MSASQDTLFPDTPTDYPTSYLPAPGPLHLQKVRIANFKKLENVEIDLTPFTVLTGVNNSGKSTILQAIWVAFECLRLCVDRQTWQVAEAGRALVAFDFFPANKPEDMWYGRKFRTGNAAKPISIRVALSNGFFFDAQINFYFGAINLKIVDWNRDMGPDAVKETLSLAPMLIPGHVEIGSHEESRVPAQIHRLALSGQLSQIVRNVLLALSGAPQAGAKEQYNFEFVATCITRHFDVSLKRLQFEPERDLEIRAPYREESWELDIVSAGSGLHQILKMAAFIAWRKSRVVLLDEPDAHLHTSLQVRLASFLQELAAGLNMQVILATHSRDLISQAPMQSVIPVDSKASKLKPIQDMEHLLVEYRRLGAISNIDLALLYQTKRCLFVEGSTDVDLLPPIAARLNADIFTGPKQVVIFPFRGVEKFTMVKDLVALFERLIGAQVKWFVLRDKDACTPKILDHLRTEAKNKGITVYHIWDRYAIENYLIEPAMAYRALQVVARSRGLPEPTEQTVREILEQACQEVFNNVRSSFVMCAQDYYRLNELGDRHAATSEALNLLDSAKDLDARLKILPGSKIFGRFVQHLQEQHRLTIRMNDLIAQMDETNAPAELIEFIGQLRGL